MFIPKTLAASPVPLSGRALARATAVVVLIAAALTSILSLDILPGRIDLRPGDVAEQTIRAPRRVTFVSESETAAARAAAAESVDPRYVEIAPPADLAAAAVDDLDRAAANVGRSLDRAAAGDLTAEQLASRIDAALPSLTDEQVAMLAGDPAAGVPPMPRSQWDAVADAARSVLAATMANDVRRDELTEVRAVMRARITEALAVPEHRELAGDLAAEFLAPNMEISTEATEAAVQAAREGVADVDITVEQGETVVRVGDRVTELQVEKLTALQLTRPRLEFGTFAGNAVIGLLVAFVLAAFLWRFQPQVWHRNRSLLLFFLALLVSALVIKIAGGRTVWSFIVPAAAAVMLVAILLESWSAAAMAAALSLIAGLANGQSLELATMTLAGGAISTVALTRAERLQTFLRAGLLLAVTNVAVILAFSLFAQRDVPGIAQLLAAGLANGAVSVILAVGSFAVLGNLFGILTVFQLLELANPSSRLLRRLLLETPGTYHHSVMVGNLAERAAETIGADPLLARVAAYYHDIGKMKNPLAFIENQAGAENVHDRLPPEVSARIIAAHIRDGIDLGYEYRLPVQIIAFIPQHHGTAVMGYFYGKQLRELEPGSNVDERRFRYPGPKPQSREAAILMLADGVEASVRSLDSKDEASIRAMVDYIVDGRVEDGQLDEAEVTLANIGQIKEAFIQQLLGMYHSRIKYPENVVPLDRREAG
jgi:putative nucleotidyltransferase with HDIG domain